MALLTRMLRQAAVYWPPAGTDMFGKPAWGVPVQIRCRWEDGNEEVLSADGEKTISSAKVFVDRDGISSYGLLLQLNTDIQPNETILDLQDQNNPYNNLDVNGKPRVRRIIRSERLPDIKSRRYLRTCMVN